MAQSWCPAADRATIEARLAECFGEVFPTLSPAQIRTASVKTVGRWDSAAVLLLVARVERTFGRRFRYDEIGRFTSFASIVDVLERVAPAEGVAR
jgi:acyl carrier protein